MKIFSREISKLISISSFICLSVMSTDAYCWGEMGHSIIGAIAEERMEPLTKNFVADVLGIEPMALSATWADAVRDDQRFNHDSKNYNADQRDADDNNFSDYHFAEVPAGFTYDTRPHKEAKDSFGAVAGAISILKSPVGTYPRAAKIIALRYLVHLIGDIHQPLHIGNGYDMGANFCSVYLPNDKYSSSLHSVWDNDLVAEFGKQLVAPNDPAPRAAKFYPEYVDRIKTFLPSEFNQAKPQDVSLNAIKSWVDQSANIREASVYPDAPNSMSGVPENEKYKHRAYCMWFASQHDNTIGDTSAKKMKDIPLTAIPHLTDDYIKASVKIVENQLIVSGVRLAAILDDIALEVSKQQPVPADTQQSALKAVQQAFKLLN